ncbi:MAG: D-Ala-D-Ala carboxypeptidase family metallohydrolase [Pseudomonadota bacterium]
MPRSETLTVPKAHCAQVISDFKSVNATVTSNCDAGASPCTIKAVFITPQEAKKATKKAIEKDGARTAAQPESESSGDSSVPATPGTDSFEDFFATLNLKHFKAREFLFLGGAHAKNGLNSLPPPILFPNIVEAARILDQLREDLGAPIRLTSIYRNDDYNKAIDGAKNSQHKQFRAVDFICSDGNGPQTWGNKLLEYRKDGKFSGGVGIYKESGFVHIDTRGTDANLKGN